MTDVFETRNELEEKLLAAQEGQLDSNEFMLFLDSSQIFMPVKDPIGIEGFISSDKAVPLTLTSEDDIEVLILFTSPERSQEYMKDYPDYDGGLLVEFKWILERTRAEVGISINPGWSVGLDLEPEMIQKMKSN